MLSCLTVSFSCVVYSRRNRTPESEKKADVGISHQTENEEENFVYVSDTYISPFVVALAAGVQPLCIFPVSSLKDININSQEQQQ